MMPTEHTRHERMLEPARRSLGETAVATAWEEGRAMFVDEAIEYALATVPRRDGPADRRPAQDGSRLTPREREVAALIARGLTNQQIAAWAAEHGTSDVLTSGRSTK